MEATQLYDVTLRDGNHALRHQLSVEFVRTYCSLAEKSGVWSVEVGHGNGLGASSYLVGKSAASDKQLINAAREQLKNTKLAVHSIPGFATIERDLKPAIDSGVEVFRVATHCTEATVAERHIEFLASKGLITHGVLMMSHMTSPENLLEQARLMTEFGAQAIILMDSAGHFIPKDVSNRIEILFSNLPTSVQLGFHAHNNLGLAISNAIQARLSGATILDGAAMGLGAGAGNAQLENIVASLRLQGIDSLPLEEFYGLSEVTEKTFPNHLPRSSSQSIQSGISGVFSGYAPQVSKVAMEFGIPVSQLWDELGRRKLVAGQETMIREIATDLMNL